jgi:hypothetical protein
VIAPRHKQDAGHAPADNHEIARQLEKVADGLEARHENPYRVRAYRTAADLLEHLPRPVREILEAEGPEGLTNLPGVGRGLAYAIDQLVRTGQFSLLDELRGEADPVGLFAEIPGVGPGLAARIHRELHIDTLEELERAAHDGRLAAVSGVGPKRLRGIQDALAGRFRRRRPAPPPAAPRPDVGELLEVDRLYREKAEAGHLRHLAPRRFNPTGQAWLPILRLRRGPRRYRAHFSNTAQAHRLGRTRDWVVIYCDEDGARGQWTVVTATSGPLKGRRVVRGREHECARHYAAQEEAGGTGGA